MKNTLGRLLGSMARPVGPMTPVARLARPMSTEIKPLDTHELVKFKSNYYTPKSADELKPLQEARKLYAKMHIHNWDLLVTEGDLIKLPVNMKDVEVGSKLHFNEVSQIGSRDHTLSGERLDPSIFDLQGTVVEKSRVKREVTEHTRRRRRHVRNQVHHNCLTVIRVTKIAVKGGPEDR